MKRMLVLLLALLLCGVALAEGEGFALENGVAWGMGQGDVLALEGSSDVDYETMGLANVLDVDDAAYRGFEADAKYLFRNGALAAVLYELDAGDVNADALAAALDGEYGGRGACDASRLGDLMSALTGQSRALNAERAGDFYFDWTGPADTCVALTNRFSDDGDDLYVCFFDQAAIAALAEAGLGEPAPALGD